MNQKKQLQKQIDMLIEALVNHAKNDTARDDFLKATIAKNEELQRQILLLKLKNVKLKLKGGSK